MNNGVAFDVRKRSTLKFIFFLFITLGYYTYVWIWKLVNDLNKLDFKQKRKINFWLLMIVPIILDVCNIYKVFFTSSEGLALWNKFYFNAIALTYFIISIILLRKFEEYSQNKYKVKIKHLGIGVVCFSICYVNFAMNNFHIRVQKSIKKMKCDK